jgi:DHA1 family bicyclomycin/chloramphenicol resistance-like MFS transporter
VLPSVALLMGVGSLTPLGMHVVLPAIPTIAREVGSQPSTIQLAVSIFLATVAVTQLVYGPVSDRFGRKPPLFAGLGIFVAGSLICAFATSSATLLAGRAVQGIGACSGVVLARAMLRDVYPPERSAALQARLSALVILAPVAVAIGAGTLISWVGWRVPFLILAAFGAVLALRVLRIGETHLERRVAPGIGAMLRDFASLLRVRQFAGSVGGIALATGAFFGFLSQVPALFEEGLGIPPSRYGFYLAMMPVSFGAGSLVAMRLIPRLGSRRLALFAMWLMAAASLAMLAGAFLLPLSVASLLAPMIVFNLGQSMAIPGLTTIAVSTDLRRIGAASGLMGFLMMAAGALGAQIIALAHDGTARPLGVLVAVLGIAGALVSHWGIRRAAAEKR